MAGLASSADSGAISAGNLRAIIFQQEQWEELEPQKLIRKMVHLATPSPLGSASCVTSAISANEGLQPIALSPNSEHAIIWHPGCIVENLVAIGTTMIAPEEVAHLVNGDAVATEFQLLHNLLILLCSESFLCPDRQLIDSLLSHSA